MLLDASRPTWSSAAINVQARNLSFCNFFTIFVYVRLLFLAKRQGNRIRGRLPGLVSSPITKLGQIPTEPSRISNLFHRRVGYYPPAE